MARLPLFQKEQNMLLEWLQVRYYGRLLVGNSVKTVDQFIKNIQISVVVTEVTRLIQ